MASLVIIYGVTVVSVLLLGGYLVVCSAISREDRRKGSLRSAPSSPSARSARFLVGITGTRQDD
jgi:hypothetical protein